MSVICMSKLASSVSAVEAWQSQRTHMCIPNKNLKNRIARCNVDKQGGATTHLVHGAGNDVATGPHNRRWDIESKVAAEDKDYGTRLTDCPQHK